MNRYGSRKFIVSVVGMLIAAGLRWRGVLSDEGTVTVLVTAVLGYQGANVGQKAIEARVEKQP